MAVKTTPKKSTAAKATTAAKTVKLEVVGEVLAPRETLKKKDIVERAVEISGVKKTPVRLSRRLFRLSLPRWQRGRRSIFPRTAKSVLSKTRMFPAAR